MFLKHTQALLEKAARSTLESIRRDRAKVTLELKPLLGYIEEHLFDSDFSVEMMRAACGARDNSVVTRFRRRLGIRIRDYVKEHRLQVGRKLLEHLDLKVWMIAELVGFSSSQLFTRNFNARFGLSPRDLRRQLALSKPVAGTNITDRDFSVLELRQGLEGLLAPEHGRALAQWLLAQYPPDGEGDQSLDGQPLKVDSEVLWEKLRDLPAAEQQATMQRQVAEVGREFFELLSEKSRVEGCRNRQCGTQLAELALESLNTFALALGDELPGLRALAWARIANARRLALDFTAAEEAFRQSAYEWSASRQQPSPGIEAELLTFQAAFRAMQHRFSEAKDLASQALQLISPRLQPRLLAQTLIVRASIAGREARLQDSITDLRRALDLVELEDGRLRLALWHNLATAYVDAGQISDANEILPLARAMSSTHGSPLEQFQLQWVEGRVAKGLGQTTRAERCFLAAHEGFVAIGESAHAAVVAVELALIYCRQGRAEALELSTKAIPILEAFKFRSEALAARRLLDQSVARKHITPDLLRKVRTVLNDLLQDPAVSLRRRS